MSYTRPGVAGAVQLVNLLNNDNEEARMIWRDIESKYSKMIFEKGGEKLKILDEYCESLARSLKEKAKSGDKCFISHDELLKVVEWKFAKGKPRFALMKYLNANSDKQVEDASSRAFSPIQKPNNNDQNNIKNSINSLCELKGVGPATASAVLCLLRPDLFSFMDDEVIECLYDAKRAYTYKVYEKVNHKCFELANTLGDEWTPWRVGRVIWTAAKLHATSDQWFLKTLSNDMTKMKRKLPTKAIDSGETRSKNSRPARKRKKSVEKI